MNKPDELMEILKQTYEQGVFEADKVAYAEMNDAHKGPRMGVRAAHAAISKYVLEQQIKELEAVVEEFGRWAYLDDRIAQLQSEHLNGEQS